MIYLNIQIYLSHSFHLNMVIPVIQVNLLIFVMMAKLLILVNQRILMDMVILVNSGESGDSGDSAGCCLGKETCQAWTRPQ